jgi:hypothetical protein
MSSCNIGTLPNIFNCRSHTNHSCKLSCIQYMLFVGNVHVTSGSLNHSSIVSLTYALAKHLLVKCTEIIKLFIDYDKLINIHVCYPNKSYPNLHIIYKSHFHGQPPIKSKYLFIKRILGAENEKKCYEYTVFVK